jgi:phage shock protein A
MISEKFLIKAANIRRDYLKLNDDINKVENRIKSIVPFIEGQQDKLNDIKNKVEKGELKSKESFAEKALMIIMDLEKETASYEAGVDDVNKKIEKLREDEIALFNELKTKYSNIPDKELKSKINEYLKSQNLL